MTINKGTGGGTDYTPGWKELTISGAEYGDWNGKRYLDISFVGYPENFTARVYEAMDKNGEEFAIGQVFRFANAGISGGLEGPGGTKIMKMDDDPLFLENKPINAYLYKDGKYSRVLKQFAPTVFENAAEKFTEDDVTYWKAKAKKFYNDFVMPKLNNTSEGDSSFVSSTPVSQNVESSSTGTGEEIPF